MPYRKVTITRSVSGIYEVRFIQVTPTGFGYNEREVYVRTYIDAGEIEAWLGFRV